MYSSAITSAAVDSTNAAQGWDLRYHSQAQVDAAIGHFHDLWDVDAKRLTRPLTPDEQRFITNERKLCALDFRGYWLPRYAWIVNWRKEPQRFVPNVAQEIVMDLWAEDESAGNAIWMQQLKARRLGVSTISELNVCHRYQFIPYSNCVVASADPDKTIEMAGMIKFCLDQQPWWLLPTVTKIKSAIPVEFGEMHSTLAIQAGNQFTGVARGSSPNIIHLSELCEWQDAEDIVDGALMRAVIDNPGVFGILESTALGVGTWWHRTWEQNKRDYARGTARVRPVFLPWYVGSDIYPTPTDMRKRPIPPTWAPSDRTINHAERARQYVLTNPLLFRYLARGNADWQMPREQMWFREIEYETAREKKQLNVFLAEMCADDFEAFQSSNIPVIDPEILIGYQERTRQPLGVYTIIGPDIPPALVIPRRYHDTSQPTVTISTREILPKLDVKYQLVPLVFEGYPSFDEQLKLLIYEWPAAYYTYGVGVDCCEGVGQDNASIEVLREATPQREPGQVAEFVSNSITAFQMWPVVLAISSLYSVVSPTAGKRTQCKLAIEAFTNGAACQNELQKRGWWHFHAWKYNDKRKPQTDGQVQRIGVYTNNWFRSTMMDMLMTCLSEEAIDIPSPYLVQELTTLEQPPGGGKIEAAPGSHDDRVMSLGFPLFSLHMNKPPSKQYTRRRVTYVPGLQEDDPEPHPIWSPGAQGRADVFMPSGKFPAQPIFRNRDKGALGKLVNPNMPIRFR